MTGIPPGLVNGSAVTKGNATDVSTIFLIGLFPCLGLFVLPLGSRWRLSPRRQARQPHPHPPLRAVQPPIHGPSEQDRSAQTSRAAFRKIALRGAGDSF